MDLGEYLHVLRRRWWVVVLVAVLGFGAALGIGLAEQPRYQSTIQIAVSGASNIGGTDEITQHALAAQRALLFSQIAPKDDVVRSAEAELVKSSPKALTGADISVSASGPSAQASQNLATQSPFFTVTVTANSARAAQALAATFPAILPAQYSRLNKVPLTSVNDLLTTVAPASYSSSPSSPNVTRDALIGLAAGLVVGIGIVLLLDVLDTTLRDSADVRQMSDAQVLGVVPREFTDEQLPAATRPHSRRSEAYRQIRTNVEFAGGDDPPQVIAVTSPGPGDGKSSTSANLALLTSRAGKRAAKAKRVVLVDADLRKPTIANYFRTDAERGLSDVLAGRAQLSDVLRPVPGENLTVLPSGRVPDEPSELLDSPALTGVLNALRDEFDLVIVDTPPVLAVTDALLVSAQADGVIVVTRMRNTTRQALRRAIESIEHVRANIFGLVVNATDEREEKRYGYAYGYGYGYASPGTSDHHDLTATADGSPRPRPPASRQPAGMPGPARHRSPQTGDHASDQ